MALTSGTRLGPYEITAQIRVGGMEGMYRATDTTLNRDVAIRVLPESLANDPDRITRFRREIKTLASLNHPNIAHIHGPEESGEINALVMELVEGPMLTDRIARGAIPVREALPIARQIAKALEAAHAHGITHGDLRPVNVEIGQGAAVKVIGFGLSTRGGASAADPSARDATLSYAAPEQLRGDPATPCSDVWALGVTLCEMLTGARPVERQFAFELSSALFDQLSASHPTDAPSVLRRVAKIRSVVERCMANAPSARYPTAFDVLAALEAVHPDEVEASSSAWTSMLSRGSAVGVVAAVVAEGERRVRRDRRAREDRRKRHLGPPGGIERRKGERRTSLDRRCG